jgi:hypothetical protein
MRLRVINGVRELARKNTPNPPVRPTRRIASATSEGRSGVWRPMPQEARERLERALCGVLERRYPGRRFAMKDQLDTLSHRPAAACTTAANTHGLKDAA